MLSFKSICIAIFALFGTYAILGRHLLPLPLSTPGEPMSFLRNMAVMGYIFGFCAIGALLGAGLDKLYRLFKRK